MELKMYFDILARRWQIALLFSLVIVSVFVLGSKYIRPNYQAETDLQVITPLGGSLDSSYHEDYYANRLMNTYAQIATSEQVMNELKEKLNLEKLPEINVQIIPDSEIIQILVVSPDPALSAQVANGLAEVIISKQAMATESSSNSGVRNILNDRLNELEKKLEQSTLEHNKLVQIYAQTTAQIATLEAQIRMKETLYQSFLNRLQQDNADNLEKDLEVLMQQREKLLTDSYIYSSQITLISQNIQSDQSGYSDLLYQYDNAWGLDYIQNNAQGIVVITPAVEPLNPTGLGRWFIVGLGMICGLIGGISLAFVLDNLDTRIFTPEQINQITATPVLGRFPQLQVRKHKKTPQNNETFIYHKDYWMVCARILAILQNESVKTILVTSPTSMAGKSTFISNIAIALARNNCKVLIVDADFRKPQQHQMHQLSGEQDLSSLLRDDNITVEDVIQKNVKPGVDLVPNFTEYSDPAEMLNSPRLGILLKKIMIYDVVLFDSPALFAAPDAYNLSKIVDGVIVIAQWGHTTKGDIKSICNYLEGIGSKLLGVVLNQVPIKADSSNYYRKTKRL